MFSIKIVIKQDRFLVVLSYKGLDSFLFLAFDLFVELSKNSIRFSLLTIQFFHKLWVSFNVKNLFVPFESCRVYILFAMFAKVYGNITHVS